MNKFIFLVSGININSAPFNRFITIVKSVKALHYETDVICIRPVKYINGNLSFNGKNTLFYENIYFRNILINNKKTIIKKFIFRFKSYYYSLKLINKTHGHGKSFLYLNSLYVFDHVLFFLVSRLYGFKFLHERSEYPVLIRSPKIIKTNVYKYLILSWSYRLFDGLVIMTKNLAEFYKRYTKKKCRILILPMTVDLERFDLGVKKNVKYIGYVGSLDCAKDGLDILIRAFGMIHHEFPEYNLRITGKPQYADELKLLTDLTSSLALNGKVHFEGEKNRADIPEFLCSASLLVLARPKSKQAEGGFPTKLGEYLATGNPVIVTDVGEITEFVHDNIDAYVVQPGNIEELGLKMRMVLTDYEGAKKIGAKGKENAKRNFDYHTNVNRLREFIDSF